MAILLVLCERENWRVNRRFESTSEEFSWRVFLGFAVRSMSIHSVMQNYGTSFLLVSENRVQSCQELVKFAESRPKLAI